MLNRKLSVFPPKTLIIHCEFSFTSSKMHYLWFSYHFLSQTRSSLPRVSFFSVSSPIRRSKSKPVMIRALRVAGLRNEMQRCTGWRLTADRWRARSALQLPPSFRAICHLPLPTFCVINSRTAKSRPRDNRFWRWNERKIRRQKIDEKPQLTRHLESASWRGR